MRGQPWEVRGTPGSRETKPAFAAAAGLGQGCGHRHSTGSRGISSTCWLDSIPKVDSVFYNRLRLFSQN